MSSVALNTATARRNRATEKKKKTHTRQNECQWHSSGLFTAIVVKCQMVGPAGRQSRLGENLQVSHPPSLCRLSPPCHVVCGDGTIQRDEQPCLLLVKEWRMEWAARGEQRSQPGLVHWHYFKSCCGDSFCMRLLVYHRRQSCGCTDIQRSVPVVFASSSQFYLILDVFHLHYILWFPFFLGKSSAWFILRESGPEMCCMLIYAYLKSICIGVDVGW